MLDASTLPQAPPMQIGRATFKWGTRTFVMGILNASPDSFSGDGLVDPDEALRRAEAMMAAGADMLDIGAESTRPDFQSVDADEEWKRLQLVLGPVRRAFDLPISVDTSKADVARRAVEYGADAVNDVTGCLGDPEMPRTLAALAVPVIAMHNQRGREFGGDVIGDALTGLEQSLKALSEAGVPRERVIVDPGYGFGWGPVRDFEMLRRLGELKDLGRPVLIGTSRKSSIGYVIDRPAQERVFGTAATIAIAVANGADIVRVHDVEEMVRVAKVTDAVVRVA